MPHSEDETGLMIVEPTGTIEVSMDGRTNDPIYSQADMQAMCGWLARHDSWWMVIEPHLTTFTTILDQARVIDALLLGLVREVKTRIALPAPDDPTVHFGVLERALRARDINLSEAAFKAPADVRLLLDWIRTTNRWWMFRSPYRERLQVLWRLDSKFVDEFGQQPDFVTQVNKSGCPDPSTTAQVFGFVSLLWLSFWHHFWAYFDPRPA